MKNTVMKSIKVLTIIICLSFYGALLFSQETAGEIGGTIVTDNKADTGIEGVADTAGKIPVNAGDEEVVKTSEKPVSEGNSGVEKSKKTPVKKKKTPSISEEPVQKNNDSNEGDDYLLLINEGNFKYKRIPDIKIADSEPVMVEQINQETADAADTGNQDDSAGKGFFGLSKSTADVVAKGGILLMVLVIFILYKTRSRSSVRRSSARNVMNSYRK
ncbi:MAG TPA: hypothetical protein PK906_11310 [Spirochaetota bacterium]|nr:hypothetical protein [Spirochaetota bacterium]